MLKPKVGMTSRTGQKCPKSGVWRVVGVFDTATMSVSKGNKMPPHDKRPVTWRLVFAF